MPFVGQFLKVNAHTGHRPGGRAQPCSLPCQRRLSGFWSTLSLTLARARSHARLRALQAPRCSSRPRCPLRLSTLPSSVRICPRCSVVRAPLPCSKMVQLQTDHHAPPGLQPAFSTEGLCDVAVSPIDTESWITAATSAKVCRVGRVAGSDRAGERASRLS